MAVNDKEYFEYVTNYFPKEINEDTIIKEIYRINEENFYFVQGISKQISNRGIDLKTMKDVFRRERKDLFGERVLRNVVFGR